MKKFLFLLSTIVCITANAQHSNHWKIISYYQTNLGNAQPGDTLVFNGNYTYLNNNGISGNSSAPIVLFMQNAHFSKGLDFHDAAYFHIYGIGTDSSNYSFAIENNPSGTALSFQGKSHDIEIDHYRIVNVAYFCWFKDDASQHPCDSSHYIMRNFYTHDGYCDTSHQDGFYLMSTDEGGIRTVTCNGKTARAQEYYGAAIRMDKMVIKNCQRNGINYSNVIDGSDSNFIINTRIENCGYEYKLTHDPNALYQGAGIATGSYVNGLTIANCIIRNTFLPNIVLRAGGKVNCYNNTLDSADNVWNFLNPQKNAALQVTASTIYPTIWNIHNNKIGWSNNNVQAVFYGQPVSSFIIICGDTLVNNITSGMSFSGCKDGLDSTKKDSSHIIWQYTYTTKQVTHDTLVAKTKDSVINKIADTTVYSTLKFGSTTLNTTTDISSKLQEDSLFTVIIKATTTHDSVFIDSIKVQAEESLQSQSINVGIMPFNIADAYNSAVTRDEINYQYWQQQPALIARIKSYNQDSVIININNKNADLSPAKFVHDTISYKQNLIAIQKATGIKTAVIENENDSKDFDDSVSNYINEVTAAVHAFQGLGVTVYNGGFIKIRFWYYLKTHDTDFLNTCIPLTAKGALLRGQLAVDSASVQKQINAFKPLLKQGFHFNTHQLYISDTAEFAGLHRMIEYFDKETGDTCISNEAGIYVSDPALVKGLVQLARDEDMKWMILYSGVNTGSDPKKAMPISQQDFANSLQ